MTDKNLENRDNENKHFDQDEGPSYMEVANDVGISEDSSSTTDGVNLGNEVTAPVGTDTDVSNVYNTSSPTIVNSFSKIDNEESVTFGIVVGGPNAENTNTIATVQRTPRSRKRKSKYVDLPSKKRNITYFILKKYALCLLNKLKPGVTYVEHNESASTSASASAFTNNPFKISVTVNNVMYIRQGRSRKTAKRAAAQAALASILNFQDFEKDAFSIDHLIGMKNYASSSFETDEFNFEKLLKSLNLENEIEVSLLNGMHPALNYNIVKDKSANVTERYRAIVEINGKSYEGTGRSTKLAKASVARLVLHDFFNDCYTQVSLLPESGKNVDLIAFSHDMIKKFKGPRKVDKFEQIFMMDDLNL